jgi:hypothetical protein
LASPLETSESPISFEDLDEFPALPDFTIPFLGGIDRGSTRKIRAIGVGKQFNRKWLTHVLFIIPVSARQNENYTFG